MFLYSFELHSAYQTNETEAKKKNTTSSRYLGAQSNKITWFRRKVFIFSAHLKLFGHFRLFIRKYPLKRLRKATKTVALLKKHNKMFTKVDVILEGAPQRLQKQYDTIFTKSAKEFLWELVTKFDTKVERILLEREKRKIDIATGKWVPKFQTVQPSDWTIAEIPQRIRNRKVDLGDISPANTVAFTDALYADVQGIQVIEYIRDSIGVVLIYICCVCCAG